ncbi:MAG: vanadium-dependent haloperoxidase [Wenzhouxiangellaceae bacterium]
MSKVNDSVKDTEVSDTQPSRRKFLKLSAGSGAALAAGAVAGTLPAQKALADDFSPFDVDPSAPGASRAIAAFRLKVRAGQQHLLDTYRLGHQLDNNDEQRYAGDNYYASFTKTLPSDQFGEVDPAAFQALQRAMRTGRRNDFNAIPLDPTAARRLANPQGAFKFEVSALDNHATRINPSHTFRSAELAAEMGEVYWQALARDVPFINYDTDATVAAAVSDLNNFSAPPGATMGGQITSGTLFRGETPGDLSGPFVSQFLLKDFNFGPAINIQRYGVPLAGVDFMTDQANWLNVQRGGAPAENLVFDPVRRYIYNYRALGEYVHTDVSFQAYLNAALILLGYGGGAIDQGNPYANGDIDNQGGFTSLGGPFVLDMVTKAANLSLTGAWFQKWRVHRLLRPEAYAGRVHFQMNGQRSYELHPDILNSDAAARVFSQNGTYFLPMAFTEGSPTHPSYPAGHATIAGACTTILKAFFNEDFIIPNPVQADATGENLLAYGGGDLTVGGELNKLANNVAIARDAAGVHYRQDGIQGIFAGEQQAIALLQDQSRTLNESNFDGFTLTKFDGTRIKIIDGRIRNA